MEDPLEGSAELAYLDKLFTSIRENAKTLVDNDNKLKELLKLSNAFYLSLFNTKTKGGVFNKRQIDKALKKIPPSASDQRSSQGETSGASTSGSNKKRKNKGFGLGKGNPGNPRKDTVTKRQQQNRAKPSFQARKRKAEEKSAAAKQPTVTPTSSEGTNPKRPHLSSGTHSPPPEREQEQRDDAESAADDPPLQPTHEERQPLYAQVKHAAALKTVNLIQTLAGARKDTKPTAKELELYWQQMNSWEKLDKRISGVMEQITTEWLHELGAKQLATISPTFLKQMISMSNTANGVANCAHHILGSMVSIAVAFLGEDDDESTTTSLIEELSDHIKQLQYQEYVNLLTRCGCEACTDVLKFDQCYNRYHDAIEANSVPDDDEPKFEKRPLHCENVELAAQYLKNKYMGLSDSSLTKFYYFSKATPPFSPPAVSLGPPTQVMEAVNRYMQRYLQERKLNDPLPSSWRIQGSQHEPENLVEIAKDDFHLWDGDSCEIYVPRSSQNTTLSQLRTHGNHIRVRLPYQDAPESDTSVRIYKQSPNSDVMTPFMTRHMGIESLRAARQAVFEAEAIYLHVPRDRMGKSILALDFYHRQLADVWLRFGASDYRRLSVHLAALGYTMTFYTTGVDDEIHTQMQTAMTKGDGLFNLPDEIFCYPFRPWDIRRLKRNDGDADAQELLKQYSPILNSPANPDVMWKPSQRAAPVGFDDEHDSPCSQEEDSFYFRIVECPLRRETLCFRAKSSIPGSGYGLFLKPHFTTLKQGMHLCLYADKATTEDELTAAGSSRMYLVQTRSGLYDADQPTGNNLGRYANQRGIVESLRRVKELSTIDKPPMTDGDWVNIENHLEDLANAKFKVVSSQLVVVAKEDMPAADVPTEIFTNYGGLRNYWLNAETQQPGCFGGEISRIIYFLLNSENCNWSPQQRRDWSRS